MPTPTPTPSVCVNTDFTVNDAAGDGCDWYADRPDSCGNYDSDTFRASEMCCGCNGGSTDLLSDPQWNINLDYAQADIYIADLDSKYQDLMQRMTRVTTDWQTDRTIVDNYYWNKKLMPLVEEGSRLDEKTMRTIVTWIADGTQVKGKPIAEVFPGIKDWMLENYNPEGNGMIEMFGLDRMPMSLQEYDGADWFEYYTCFKDNAKWCTDQECVDLVASSTCWGYDTWNNDFYQCLNSEGTDCEGLGIFAANQYFNK